MRVQAQSEKQRMGHMVSDTTTRHNGEPKLVDKHAFIIIFEDLGIFQPSRSQSTYSRSIQSSNVSHNSILTTTTRRGEEGPARISL